MKYMDNKEECKDFQFRSIDSRKKKSGKTCARISMYEGIQDFLMSFFGVVLSWELTFMFNSPVSCKFPEFL